MLSSAPSNPGSWATPRTPGRGAPSLAASAVGWRGTTGLPCTEVGRFLLLSTATTCAPWRRVPSAAGGVPPNDIIDNIAMEPPASASARNRRRSTNERDKGERSVSIPADRSRGLRNAQRPPAHGVHRHR
ncbi:unnamed protein product [Ectocarpus sp. 8 AP-2014]